MKEINQEQDYLQRLRNTRDNLYLYIKDQDIKQNSLLGETFTIVLKMLEDEIVNTAYIRTITSLPV